MKEFSWLIDFVFYPRQYLTFPVKTVMIIKVTRDPVGFYANVSRFTLQLTSIKLKDTKFKNTNKFKNTIQLYRLFLMFLRRLHLLQ